MSSMPAQTHHSAACCNVPPVVIKGYQEKGTYETVDNLKTYVTGPADAKKGILVIYDIFGYFPQTLQGADILAHSGDSQKYRVVIPDWFEGKPCPIEWYPPNTEQKQKDLGAWFSNWPPTKAVDRLPSYLEAARAQFPDTTEWAIIGYCWGGKVASLIGATDLFKAVATCHPAMIEPKDAENVKVPMIMLPSMEEDADAVDKFEKTLKVPHHVETFSDQVHGWMAARADLEDDRVREEYVRGYKLLLKFFGEHF
jgi:dienelactone hydrolase